MKTLAITSCMCAASSLLLAALFCKVDVFPNATTEAEFYRAKAVLFYRPVVLFGVSAAVWTATATRAFYRLSKRDLSHPLAVPTKIVLAFLAVAYVVVAAVVFLEVCL
ncbi:MAG: hypothetical protein ACTHLW_21860 [Verrucomicrobiota bacterium]